MRLSFQHRLRSAAAACSCTASVPPGASSPTSAATPPHSRTLFRWIRLSFEHRLRSAAAAGSRTASVPPGASSPTRAATPPHALTLSLSWVVSLSRVASATAARSCAAAAAPYAVAGRTRAAGTPAETPGTGAPTSQPASRHSAIVHVKAGARREQAHQRRSVGASCRLLAAVASVPKPQPHAAHGRAAELELERAGAAIPVGSAGAPALERGAWLGHFTDPCWARRAHVQKRTSTPMCVWAGPRRRHAQPTEAGIGSREQ
jgi:hypothetical protein